MEKDEAGPSTSKELDLDIGERSFFDKNFKGKFTNAFLAAKCIYKERNLSTDKPSEKIDVCFPLLKKHCACRMYNIYKMRMV